MTIQSATSTLDESWSRRVPASSPAEGRGRWPPPLPMGAHFPPRRAATDLAADELPRGKVLVVEDEAIVALDLQRTLRDAGYRVIGPAATLGDIQRLIERGSIDCAILDVDVNRRTPLPVADLLAFADVPFVFLTAGARVDVPHQHAHRPMVRKPYTRAELIAAVERAMRRRSLAANDNPYRVEASRPAWPRVFPSL